MRPWIVALALLWAPGAAATEILAATPEQGAAVLSAQDDFMQALTPADLSIRLGDTPDLTTAALGRFYASQTRAWTPAEQARLTALTARVQARIDALDAWLPDTILLIKGTPQIDGGMPHTRGAAIVMGASLPDDDARLEWLFFHELFHVLSRANADRHDDLYSVIGFQRCSRMNFAPEMRSAMFTNPDAPQVLHAAPISAADPSLLATPVLLANPPHYDPSKPHLRNYFQIAMVALRRGPDGACTPVTQGAPDPAAMTAAIYAGAGRNTAYIFHPEELMADNFADLMTARSDAPDPWVYDRLRTVLAEAPAP
jgi:hypothetical protein